MREYNPDTMRTAIGNTLRSAINGTSNNNLLFSGQDMLRASVHATYEAKLQSQQDALNVELNALLTLLAGGPDYEMKDVQEAMKSGLIEKQDAERIKNLMHEIAVLKNKRKSEEYCVKTFLATISDITTTTSGAQTTEWLGEESIWALSSLYEVVIILHQPNAADQTFDVNEKKKGKQIVHLYYNGVDHYTSSAPEASKSTNKSLGMRPRATAVVPTEVQSSENVESQLPVYEAPKYKERIVEFPCTQCDLKFDYEGPLNQHIQAVHNKRYECQVCNKLFGTMRDLKRHMAVHTNNTFIPDKDKAFCLHC